MALSQGSRLGPYEIVSAIGAGGMGEVYRARDINLGRDVAIKVLPEAFARDPDRMARFGREAKLLAALDHSNIASIYGLEDSGNTHALVMQLAEGPTLADRVAQGPIPIEDALRIAKRIADALEYAHEKGIIHRDLKPANVKVANDDTVKILDFGLAKALENGPSATDIANSPTLSHMATQAGMLLGTAAYMSPEQAKGKSVDRRADIWAFGCVLYEMLTGKKAFPGEVVTDTLAAVLTKDPDLSQLPAATPMRVRVLLQRCLQKDPKQRLQAIGDARISLEEVLSSAPEAMQVPGSTAPAWRRALPWVVAALLFVTLSPIAFLYFREKPVAPVRELRYQIFAPKNTTLGTDLALSPDGRYLAFTAKGQDARTQLFVRDLSSLESRPLPGTQDATQPFWSPDSRSVGFFAVNKIERVAVSADSAPQTICDATVSLGGSWNQNGMIVFGSMGGLMKVSAAGGTPSPLTKVDPSRGESVHSNPDILPDGRHFLYLRPGSATGTYLGSLDTGNEQRDSKPLLEASTVYVPAANHGLGHLLFLQNGALMAQAFDVSRMEKTGDPALIAQPVAYFTASANGLLAYVGGTTPLQLTWFDRKGRILGTVGEPGVDAEPAISPDGSAVVVSQGLDGAQDLWLYNPVRGTRTRLTFDGKNNQYPVWSPDGSHVVFRSTRDGTNTKLYEKAVNGVGQAEVVDKTPGSYSVPLDWSRDGRYLFEGVQMGRKLPVWVLPLSTGGTHSDRKSFPYLDSKHFNEIGAKLSPNGRWLAYASDETGRYEIYVQTFPKPGGKWPVSINGGTRPVWSYDGRELYFIGADGKLMEVDVKSGAEGNFEAGTPRMLFDPHIGGAQFSWFGVAKDGRFLIARVAEQSGTPITVVSNWQAAPTN